MLEIFGIEFDMALWWEYRKAEFIVCIGVLPFAAWLIYYRIREHKKFMKAFKDNG